MYQTMKVVVSVNAFTEYLKACSLPHVHYAIDNAAEKFMGDRCPHTFMRRLRDIPEVSHEYIVAYIRAAENVGGVTEFARVYE